MGTSWQGRFWERVEKSDGCWMWRGYVHNTGYGMMQRDKKRLLAHRASWEIAYGPTDLDVLHHCDTPLCVRPGHLFTGTQADNNRDRDRKGRHFQGWNGTRPNAKLTMEQAQEIRIRYVAGGIEQKDLAAEYGVSKQTIHYIVHGKTWNRG